jgi:hypothetical protein
MSKAKKGVYLAAMADLDPASRRAADADLDAALGSIRDLLTSTWRGVDPSPAIEADIPLGLAANAVLDLAKSRRSKKR